MNNTKHKDDLPNVFYTVQYPPDTIREKQCMWDTLREECTAQDAGTPQVCSTAQCIHVDGVTEAQEEEDNLFL